MGSMITIDSGSAVPPSEQVRAQLALLIEIGTLQAGARLPPLRQLANDLGLAKGTVGRAYSALEAHGLVRTARGGGTRVSQSVEHVPAVLDASIEYADHVAAAGASLEHALAAVRAAWGSGDRASGRIVHSAAGGVVGRGLSRVGSPEVGSALDGQLCPVAGQDRSAVIALSAPPEACG